ncbi:MAG: DNA-directed RNA polymerase core subunit rpc40 [Alyxoria varia]|nr:MAG: DNA-directed RNA polymerase core subunit rpc40 [Alyxoria varia]
MPPQASTEASLEKQLRITTLLRRKPGTTEAEFHDYWSHKHGPLAEKFFVKHGLIAYKQVKRTPPIDGLSVSYHTPSSLGFSPSPVVSTPTTASGGGHSAQPQDKQSDQGGQLDAVDGIADLIVPDEETLRRIMEDPEYHEVIRPDELKFLDGGPGGKSVMVGWEEVRMEAGKVIVQVGVDGVGNTSSNSVPFNFNGEEDIWTVDSFREKLRVQIHRNEPNEAVFSLVGIDASLANAFRRILLAELPTVAIEDVFIRQNTSIIQDEVLAHRLGLVPLKGNKGGLRWLNWRRPLEEDKPDGLEEPTYDFNTIQLELKIKCDWQKHGKERAGKQGETNPERLYKDHHVYAHQIHFTPFGHQATKWFTPEAGPIEPINREILVAKLRPGHELDIIMHARKGIGRDHAKYSPVATASYRLLPTIDIKEPILGADARKFAECFPSDVIGLEPTTTEEGKKDVKAVVKNSIKDTVSRECLRHEEFKDKVKLGRDREHFIFSVESVGQFDSDELFVDAVKVMRAKCARLKQCLSELREVG